MSSFDFIGFDASTKLQRKAESKLKQLLKMSKGIVDHDAYVVKTRAGFYEGSIKINTIWEGFSESATDRTPEGLIAKLGQKMCERITANLRSRSPILPTGTRWLGRSSEDLFSDYRHAS